MQALSQPYVAWLLAAPSAHGRADLAGKLGQEIDNPALSAREVQLAEDIVRLLANDIEERVRENLSRSLRNSSRLPYDVALRLARDIENVALPILAGSAMLTPDDLVEIVRSGSSLKQEAIAGRPGLAEKVSDEIITLAPAAAVTTLMRNATAQISERGFGKAIERFSDDDAVTESIVRRETLPVSIAERLVAVVSDQLQEYLVSHHELPSHVVSDIVSQSSDVTMINLSDGCDEAELARLVGTMHRHGRLTPFLVLRSLCMGDMAFFETAMATIANVPLVNARQLIEDAGPNGLKSLFEKSRFPSRLFPALRVAVGVAREVGLDGTERDPERYRVRMITRVLDKFAQIGETDRDYVLNKLVCVLTFVSKNSPCAVPASA